jgi:hypothetical protein
MAKMTMATRNFVISIDIMSFPYFFGLCLYLSSELVGAGFVFLLSRCFSEVPPGQLRGTNINEKKKNSTSPNLGQSSLLGCTEEQL